MITHKPLPRAKTPEEAGVSSQGVHEFLRAVEQAGLELHSFMVLRHGIVAAECFRAPFTSEYRHQMWSVSKTFVATALGSSQSALSWAYFRSKASSGRGIYLPSASFHCQSCQRASLPFRTRRMIYFCKAEPCSGATRCTMCCSRQSPPDRPGWGPFSMSCCFIFPDVLFNLRIRIRPLHRTGGGTTMYSHMGTNRSPAESPQWCVAPMRLFRQKPSAKTAP